MKEPNPSGDFRIQLPFGPVSLQSSSEGKRSLQERVRQAVAGHAYYLSGDVSISIEWLVPEKLRYESNHAPDVDNAIKPILDGLSGPFGILINDNQVQDIGCHWIDIVHSQQSMSVLVRYQPDDYLCKDGLFFVEFPDNMCSPLNESWDPHAQVAIVEHHIKRLATRDKMIEMGAPRSTANSIMPIQRSFYRPHLNGFTVIPLADFRLRHAGVKPI